MSYVAPMRRAVIWLCSIGRPWDLAALMNAGDVEERRAIAYVTSLSKQRVLRLVGRFVTPGRCFRRYANSRVATRPGGNANRYRDAARRRASSYMQDVDQRRILGHQLCERRQRAQISLNQVSLRAGVDASHLWRVERGENGISEQVRERVELVIEASYQELLRVLKKRKKR